MTNLRVGFFTGRLSAESINWRLAEAIVLPAPRVSRQRRTG